MVNVGARSFTELDAWQLANELKLAVYVLIRSREVQRDVEFRNQLRNAAASAPRNLAEGFGRYFPREFSQYLRIANGSLMETSNHGASAASMRLIRYLVSAPARVNPRTRAPARPYSTLRRMKHFR